MKDENGAETQEGQGGSRITDVYESISSPIGPRLLDERYEIMGLLGSGGMGSVYKVRDLLLDEVVALKTLNKELAEDSHSLARFRREVKLARRVTHPNVARTFDIGSSHGSTYLTMEFVDGESLRARQDMAECLTVTETLEIMAQVCEGLQAAHDASVIHRDLKPDNVMLATDGRAVVTDFGVARAPRRSDNLTQTSGGGVMGTPQYMAPEQVEGQDDLDGRADVYSVGVMLFELLSGEKPWKGDSQIAVAVTRLMQGPPRLELEGAPERLIDVVEKAMARERDERYASASELGRDLVEIAASMVASDFEVKPSAESQKIHTPAPQTDTTLAVLPVHNRLDKDMKHLSSGFADELAGELGILDDLLVRPTGAVRGLDTEALGPQELGRELGVDVVVDTSMRCRGDELRVRVALISVEDGFQIWGSKFSGDVRDIFEIAEDVSAAIADALATRRGQSNRPDAITNPKAIEYYMRGRRALVTSWHTGSLEAIELFEKALDFAPEDPRVLTGLAAAHSHATTFCKDNEVLAQHHSMAKWYAETAFAHAPTWANPHYALALVAYNTNRLKAARRHAKDVLELQPNHSYANHLLGRIYARIGDLELAVRHFEHALTIDDGLAQARIDLARVFGHLGEWEKAEDMLDHVIMGGGSVAGVASAWMLRLTIWKGEAPGIEQLAHLHTIKRLPRVLAAGANALLEDDPRAAMREALPSIAERARSKRNGSRLYQYEVAFVAEFAAWCGLDDLALDAIEEFVDLGHVDMSWLERTPIFSDYAPDARFVACIDASCMQLK